MNNREQEDLEISGGLSVRPIIERQGRMKMIGSCMKMNIAYILCVTSVGMDWVCIHSGQTVSEWVDKIGSNHVAWVKLQIALLLQNKES